MQIFVKTLMCKMITLEVKASDMINNLTSKTITLEVKLFKNVKAKIQDQEGIYFPGPAAPYLRWQAA